HALAGIPFRGSPPWMWDQVQTLGHVHFDAVPSPGDIAFFDDTYDRNGDRQRNDPKSHVAIVLSADAATGDILLAHGGSTHGRALFHMNLRRPSDPDANSGIRRPSASDRPGVPRLAGELFTGFGRVGSGAVTGSRPARTPCSPSPCSPPCSACGSPSSPTAPISPSS
ncbi:MAG: hypothetical protein H0V89_11735, partial [Deltaproteobacteria bacterium]|nr:hypothetical protein [Deltaproteobacteria bacterium]